MFERLERQSDNYDVAIMLANQLIALLASVCGYVGTTRLMRAWGFIPLAEGDAQYLYTSMLLPRGRAFLVLPLLAVFLGWLTRRPWMVALGMVVPLPFAMSYEMSLNSTSHNLFPFEVVGWVMLFALWLCAAYAGRWIRRVHSR